MKILERNVGLDITRALATVFLLCVHFFANTHFYSTPLAGKNMYLQTFLRMFFLICVPLFIIITGYLQANKKPGKDYYKKLLPILIVYLIYSIFAIIINIFYFKENKSIIDWIGDVTSFKADGYSWYVNMYIGLFLITPFLNILYKNIETKKQKQLLILVLIIITAVPNLLNGKARGVIFFPDFWIQAYPITYYFIGSYIREYQIRINKLGGILLVILLTFVEAGIEFYYAKGGIFSFMAGSYPSLIVVIHATVFFLVFYDIKINNKFLIKLATTIGVLSLDIYLVSYITDRFVYKFVFDKYFQTQQHILYWYMPIVGATFCCAFILSYLRYKLIRVR